MDEVSEYFLFWLAASFGLLLAFPVLQVLGALLNRLTIRQDWFPTTFAVGAVAAGCIGGSLYLDTAGVVVPGTVVKKDETIGIRSGSWTRRLQVTVRYPTAPDHETTAVIGVDEALFDRLHAGAAVQVRYLPQLRMLARLAEQSTGSLLLMLPRALPPEAVAAGGMLAGGIGLVWAVVTGRGRPFRRWLLAPLFALGMAAAVAPLLPPLPLGEPAGPARAATAEVRRVTHITQHWLSSARSSWRADQPYELVELLIVPDGQTDPVVAVDGIDVGSVPGLQPGAVLPVTYPEGAPRAARLTRATRGHVAVNWAQVGREALFSLAGIAGLLLVTLSLRHVTRRAGRWVAARLAAATRRAGR